MKRLFNRPSRKERDVGAADKQKPRYDPEDDSTSQQFTIAPLPERLKPQAFVVTSKTQSPAGDKSSSSPSPPAPSSAESRLQLSLTTSSSRAASTTTPHNVPHGKRQGRNPSGTNAAKKDYWQLAVERLQEGDSSVADQITGVQQAAADAGDANFAVQLLRTTEQSQRVLEAKRWKIATGSREFVLRDQLDRLVKAVTLFKDVGTAAGSIDPLHAGLPLAGFCVLMQVWPITCCARPVGDTDTVLDSNHRLRTIRCNGGRR